MPVAAAQSNNAAQNPAAGLMAMVGQANQAGQGDKTGKLSDAASEFQVLLQYMTGQNNGKQLTPAQLAQLLNQNAAQNAGQGGGAANNSLSALLAGGQKLSPQDLLAQLSAKTDGTADPMAALIAQIAAMLQQYPQIQNLMAGLASGQVDMKSLTDAVNALAAGGTPDLSKYNFPAPVKDALTDIAQQPGALPATQKMLAALQNAPAVANGNIGVAGLAAQFEKMLQANAAAQNQNATQTAAAAPQVANTNNNNNAAPPAPNPGLQTNANQNRLGGPDASVAAAGAQNAGTNADANAQSNSSANNSPGDPSSLLQAAVDKAAPANTPVAPPASFSNLMVENAAAGQAQTAAAAPNNISLLAPGGIESYAAQQAAQLSAPALSPAMQVAFQIQQNAQTGQNSGFNLQLHPEELGAIQVSLKFEGNRVTAKISADKQETLDLIKNDSGALNKALQSAGLNSDQSTMEFSLNQSSQQFAQANKNNAGNGEFGTMLADNNSGQSISPDQPPTHIAMVAPGRIDVKL